jgi:shikimate dehydrogenase
VTVQAYPPETHRPRLLTGLIGRDILASRSPWLHEREADEQGVRLVYALFDFGVRGWDASDIAPVLDAAERLGFAGLNVTYPYKQEVVPFLHELSPVARTIGAVNTIQFLDGKRIGHNTDVIGFRQSLAQGLPNATMATVVQVGAGGAGVATAHALLDLGVEQLTIFDLDLDRRNILVEKLNKDFGTGRASGGDDIEQALAGTDGLVNATPVGMASYPGTPVPVDLLHPGLWVADIVYVPLETNLLREARRRGCATLDGSGMVVYQAAAAFDIFTGLTADRARMLKSFVDSVSKAGAKAA